MNDDGNNHDNLDWRRLLLRKDRPLPKAGCSWAFYIALAAIIIYLIIMFLKYNSQQ